MSLPPLAPLPPANIRLSLGPEEWEACLEAWLTLSELTLRLPASDFSTAASEKGSLPAFLTSFYQEVAHLPPGDTTFSSSKAVRLRKLAFRLSSRALTEPSSTSPTLLSWTFLADFCHVHLKSSALRQQLNALWKAKSELLTPVIRKTKDSLTKLLEAKDVAGAMGYLSTLAPVLHASADMGAFFMTGFDFLDSLISAYARTLDNAQKRSISTVAYLGLLALVRTEVPTTSVLSDHLFTLRTAADKSTPQASLLADVVTNTALVARLRHAISGKAPERLSKLLDTLVTYRSLSIARPRKHVHRKQSKGKARQAHPDAEFHMHRMSLVTQMQDLFPDLGSGFVLRLLDEYEDSVEQVTAHLLDESLPGHLSGLDRTEQAPVYDTEPQSKIDHLAPRSTPPPKDHYIPERRNVFDDDELDRLDFDTKRLRIGKQRMSTAQEDQPNKAAILSALAAFDSDDDERDDTYDVEDVGGTVDTAHPDGEPGPAARVTNEENDMALFKVYKSSPELFGRTFDVRKGQPRQALKSQTGMTDEAIEGWAIMLQRDPRRAKRLEAQAGGYDGRQTELARTSYRESPGNTETEDSDAPGGRGGFRGRGRGRGGRGRGRGGNVAGPSGEASTVQAQRRKEANKSSRANHNRRDGRAKKMARGGFPG
ncbi:CUE domain-containing protein 3 [Fulvia fulva]|uniref:CUE domain-containing protein 3 n=1 Tax=Passalora fulva TaxID=5499 RepID=A0A9Q8UV07_PASFU|nr:CUE domain-containing protein 3 [Fulvia fulva]KAK4611698.1 CUE domain-containing protein 3 [Fulvia fulva]KAK4612774.1 CUE domain-containing protein 3 [Fulvia fulva]UJO23453.1 CUE domain-containing protein 3 [Fulvia fulva]WPV21146.1 CUE domain-containing protein 3 [Fulvia fulva]WPV36158.1 CUE domain-containing protein 3 [Fulvia fulva]